MKCLHELLVVSNNIAL